MSLKIASLTSSHIVTKMPREEVRKTLLSFAYHEAGHAVVSCLLNETIEFVQVITTDEFRRHRPRQGGYISLQHEHPLNEIPRLVASNPSLARTRVACHVVTLLAGPHAQHLCFSLNDENRDEDGDLIWVDGLYFLAGPNPPIDSDLGQIQRIIDYLYPRSSGRWWHHLYMLATWTEELFRIPEVWKVTDALARCLHRKKSMEGSEVVDFMDSAWPTRTLGRKWRRRFFGR